MEKYNPVSFKDVDITGGPWKKLQEMNRSVTIYAVRDRFKDTGRFAAFKCDWTEGMPNRPHFFWDSDVAKWIESVGYICQKERNPELEALVDETVDEIAKNQMEDGYFNIYFQTVKPESKWTNRSWHELYCAGHLMEAAVAYYEATGKKKLLNCMCKYADLIEKKFAKERSAAFITPGHQEIELALVKMYRCTGEKRYLELSKFFIDKRGTDEEPEWDDPYHNKKGAQWHLPVRRQMTAEGHAVRAGYLYSGMADIALEYGDEELLSACKAIFDDIYYKKMYITGGVGSSRHGEAFTVPYDLPNKVAYAESCAAIALIFFASRTLLFNPDARYADTIERALYNGFLSSISLDGKKFFYENPLKISLTDRKRNVSVPKDPEGMPITQRVEVFSCSCCPPNITRLFASAGGYLYTSGEDTIYLHQYMDSVAKIKMPDKKTVTIKQTTNYPTSGAVKIELSNAEGKTLAVRLPAWVKKYKISGEYEVKDGYAYIKCGNKKTVNINFEMKPVLVETDPRVIENAGRAALMKGPVVFCAEGVDNGAYLDEIRISKKLNAQIGFDEELGVETITADGFRRSAAIEDFNGLYRTYEDSEKPVRVKFIPYHAFANRGETEMQVFMRL